MRNRREKLLPCAAVVLAAGEARRFGAQKLLMPFGESTIIGSVVGALSAADLAPILVVTGAHTEAIAQAIGKAAQVVRNPDPSRGMLSSIQVGVTAVPDDTRFLLALGDQPRLTPQVITHLLTEQACTGAGIVLPVYENRRGHPVLFAARYRSLILALTEAQTLRDLVRAQAADTFEVPCASDAVVRDIDTQEQYCEELHASRTEY